MNWLEEWFDKAKKVLLSPTDFYEDVERKENFSYPIKFAITSGIIGGVLLRLVNLFAFASTALWRALILGIFGGIIVGSLGLLISAGIIHLFVHLLGGRGYQRTTEAIGYPTAVNAFFGWIPFVNIVAAIYMIYIEIKGIEEFHDFSTGRAAAAVILGVVIFVVLLTILISLLFFYSGIFSPSTLPSPQFG